jgi:hypothetical protein
LGEEEGVDSKEILRLLGGWDEDLEGVTEFGGVDSGVISDSPEIEFLRVFSD